VWVALACVSLSFKRCRFQAPSVLAGRLLFLQLPVLSKGHTLIFTKKKELELTAIIMCVCVSRVYGLRPRIES
jgi:hypothetical protein